MNIQMFAFGSDDSSRTFHFDQRISNREFQFNDLDAARHCPAPDWVRSIFDLPGVEAVEVLQYSVIMYKAEMFSWDMIADQAIAIMRRQFDEVRP